MFIKLLDTYVLPCYNKNEFEVLFMFATLTEQGYSERFPKISAATNSNTIACG